MFFLFHRMFFPFRPISLFMGQLRGYICIGFFKKLYSRSIGVNIGKRQTAACYLARCGYFMPAPVPARIYNNIYQAS